MFTASINFSGVVNPRHPCVCIGLFPNSDSDLLYIPTRKAVSKVLGINVSHRIIMIFTAIFTVGAYVRYPRRACAARV